MPDTPTDPWAAVDFGDTGSWTPAEEQLLVEGARTYGRQALLVALQQLQCFRNLCRHSAGMPDTTDLRAAVDLADTKSWTPAEEQLLRQAAGARPCLCFCTALFATVHKRV